MRTLYVDSKGRQWAFEVDCTPAQGRILRAFFAALHNVGRGELKNFANLSELDALKSFRDGLEHAVLSAVGEWTKPATPEPSGVTDDVGEPEQREPYYWEKF